MRLQIEAIRPSVIPPHGHQSGDPTTAVDPREMHDQMNGERDRFPDAVERQPDVRRQHTVRESHQRLLGGVRESPD
jgi:hypothetical protein